MQVRIVEDCGIFSQFIVVVSTQSRRIVFSLVFLQERKKRKIDFTRSLGGACYVILLKKFSVLVFWSKKKIFLLMKDYYTYQITHILRSHSAFFLCSNFSFCSERLSQYFFGCCRFVQRRFINSDDGCRHDTDSRMSESSQARQSKTRVNLCN